MKQDIQLKLQAYLDGELPPGEAQGMVDLIARDAEARDLLTELTNTRAAFARHESDLKVPATREFYWSQIQREIERQEKTSASSPPETSIFTTLRRLLVPASGLAVVMLAVALAGHQFRSQENFRVEETETTFADAGAFTYRDYSSGTTLVWVDYPAENGLAEMDFDDTLELD
jgi:anti-sigma factor RsiW